MTQLPEIMLALCGASLLSLLTQKHSLYHEYECLLCAGDCTDELRLWPLRSCVKARERHSKTCSRADSGMHYGKYTESRLDGQWSGFGLEEGR